MPSEPRTLFVILNDKKVVLSSPDTTLFHDQWFIHSGLTDENMARRFLDMHVRGYYKDGQLFFYRAPTKIFDDQDCNVMEQKLPELIEELKKLNKVSPGQTIEVLAGHGYNSQQFKTITVA